MCSNFELNAVPRDIMEAFGLDDMPPMPNTEQLRPTDLSLIIGMGGTALLQPWGLAVDWSKQPMINARCETLTEKATFRGLLEQRCIVPATAYFEWRKTDGGKKLKNRISVSGAKVFAMAGLTDGERFTIVTCTPAPGIAHIHNRMPVILSADATEAWLDEAPYAAVASTLAPFEGNLSYEEEVPPAPAQGDLFG
ncbi:MAG: SOS response-associated peptidase [Rhodospirillales bacterium]|nr:SOS response-associated peptidase [Rhodospirillales bacterium]MBO6786356.1 SOS response-associated peptidase [Rhodospirillales bacterium]